MADPGKFKRILYPPSHSKGPMSYGDDIEGVKRAISKAGFWDWTDFDRNYTDDFAHGKDDRGPGVAGFQRSVGLDGTGTFGEGAFDKLKSKKVPAKDWAGKKMEHEGEPVWDDKAASLYRGYKQADADDVRKFLTEFCNKGLAAGSKWSYSQNRSIDVNVDPSGSVVSDCSGSVIQAFHYAQRKTGLDVPDPAKYAYGGWGNTWDDEDGHPKVSGSYQVGDLAHYNGHVCMCMKAGNDDSADWWSFGSEPPSKRKLHYRTDFKFVVRPPLVKT